MKSNLELRRSQEHPPRYSSNNNSTMHKRPSRAGIIDEKIDQEFLARQRASLRSGDGF